MMFKIRDFLQSIKVCQSDLAKMFLIKLLPWVLPNSIITTSWLLYLIMRSPWSGKRCMQSLALAQHTSCTTLVWQTCLHAPIASRLDSTILSRRKYSYRCRPTFSANLLISSFFCLFLFHFHFFCWIVFWNDGMYLFFWFIKDLAGLLHRDSPLFSLFPIHLLNHFQL